MRIGTLTMTTTTTTQIPPAKSLDQLAQDIKAGVALVRKAADGYLEACREVGKLLAAAKEQGKGQWDTWCKDKCGMTQQMAGYYIALVDDDDWVAVLKWAKKADDGDVAESLRTQPSLTAASKVAREAKEQREAQAKKDAEAKKEAEEKAKREAWVKDHPEEAEKQAAKEQMETEQKEKEAARKKAIEAAKKKVIEELEAKDREEAEAKRLEAVKRAKPITEQWLTQAMQKAGLKAQLNKVAAVLAELGFVVRLEGKVKAD